MTVTAIDEAIEMLSRRGTIIIRFDGSFWGVTVRTRHDAAVFAEDVTISAAINRVLELLR